MAVTATSTCLSERKEIKTTEAFIKGLYDRKKTD